MPNLNLLTSDEIAISIDFEIMKCSNLIRGVVENVAFIDEIMPLMKVDYDTMQLVLKWASQHKDDPPLPDDYEDMIMDINEIPEWDRKYLDMGQEELLDLIRAADYLHIPKLIEYCHKTVACLLTGKTASEMCDTFGVTEEVVTEKEVINKEELGNTLEFSTVAVSDEEAFSKKRKMEASKDSETEKLSLKRKATETTE